MTAAPADARSGSTVGKYRLHEIVGRGGMGVVYRAEHIYIGREVAVKILHAGFGGREGAIKRFLLEARAASLINHPNIVDVTDFGKASDGTVFFVMELLVGHSLDAVLARDHRLDLLRAITICNQLAAALAAAHHKDIIHRDLKPENVMLIPREGRRELVRRVTDDSGAHDVAERERTFDLVKILDFGVAKVRDSDALAKGQRVTQAGIVFGTPEYMAPETARIGFSDARSDIYALGIMFYEMLTGTVPFTGEAPMDVMLQQVNAPLPRMAAMAPDAEITAAAERMIMKALSKDPAHRHQSMEEFHRELQTCYGELRFRRAPGPTERPDGPTPPMAAPALEPSALLASAQTPCDVSATSGESILLTKKKRVAHADTRRETSTAAADAPILLTRRKLSERSGAAAPPAEVETPAPPEKPKRITLPLTARVTAAPARGPAAVEAEAAATTWFQGTTANQAASKNKTSSKRPLET